MSDYSQVNDYSAKDALASGNPEKLILGSDIDDELAAISTAIASKFDSADLASQAQAEAETSNVVLLTPLRLANWADYNAGIVGDLQALADPNADRILGWDDSTGAAIGFALSTGLTTSGTNLLIDTTVVPQLGSSNTFTGSSQTLSATTPALIWDETDGGADQRQWRIRASSTSFIMATYSDASVEGSRFIQANRSSTTVTSLALTATAITLNGVNASDYARLSQANTFTVGQVISNAVPYIDFLESDAAANNQKWFAYVNGAQFNLSAASDAEVHTNWLSAARSGTTVTGVSLSATTLTFTGNVSTPGASASEVGYQGTPPNDISGNVTLALTDAGKSIMYVGTGGHTVTIPANASVAFPRGTVIRILNVGSGNLSVAITSDSLYLLGTGYATSGTRTVAPGGGISIEKYNSVGWVASGVGVT